MKNTNFSNLFKGICEVVLKYMLLLNGCYGIF